MVGRLRALATVDDDAYEKAAGKALSCDGAKIGGSVFLHKSPKGGAFYAKGTSAISWSHDRRRPLLYRWQIENAGKSALSCNGAKIGGGIFLNEGFCGRGEVQFAEPRLGAISGARADT